MDWEYTDRYRALGLPAPDPATMCPGECEGTGTVPIYGPWRRDAAGGAAPLGDAATEAAYRALWERAEQEQPSFDGWHFVMCLDCHGTGRREA